MKLTSVALDRIHPNVDNPRDHAEDADIEALAEDIRGRGLLQPIVVYPHPSGEGFVVASGHRRRLALLALGVTETDVSVRPAPDGELERLDLLGVDNLHRRQLNPIEEARYYRRYLDAGATQAQVALRLHVAQSRVSALLGVLSLSRDAQRRIAAGEMTVAAATRLVRQVRDAAGIARGDTGASHSRGYSVPHFTSSHPRYQAAYSRCAGAGHDPLLRIGGACGPCWEAAILTGAGAAPTTPAQRRPVERFGDPRDILRRLRCTRCQTPAINREGHTCSAVRDGKRVFFDRHEFVIEVAPLPAGVS